MSPQIRRELSAVAIAVLASIAIGSLMILLVGRSPGHIWGLMITRTFSSAYTIGDTFYRATGLVLTGLAVSVALDAGLFNIGVEGQVSAGVLGCAVVATTLPAGTPAIVAIPLCVLAAAVGGGLVGALIGALRITRDAHEVITGIMLNYIIAAVALWIGNAALFQNGTTTGPPIVSGAELPQFLGGSSLNLSIVLAIAAVAAVWWLRARTTLGQAVRAVGREPEAARSVGISVQRIQLLAMVAAGALAGLAATNFVLGQKHAFEEGLGRGAGIAGISAALLGRMHPVGVAVAAVALGFLATGGLAVGDKVPKELTEMLQGVVLLAVAVAGPLVRRLDVRAEGSA